MKRRIVFVGWVCLALAWGQTPVHHKIVTHKKDAQELFDQGLFELYGFEFDDARTTFQRATKMDPRCAMCFWGLAMANGPNYNEPEVDAAQAKAAFDAARKAARLARGGSEMEWWLTAALAQRFSGEVGADPRQLANAYRNAMRQVQQHFPKDDDIATLYAQSIIDLRPWQLWGKDGTPAPGTEEAIALLQDVLKRDPKHIGANHIFIHAVEASPHPELGLPSAERLKTLAPRMPHLVHMPAHIYMRVGDYIAAAQSNKAAVAVDRARFKQGMYPAHDLQFLAVAATFAGRSEEALRTVAELEVMARPMVAHMPDADIVLGTRPLVLVEFRRWKDILAIPVDKTAGPVSEALLHFARGVALAETDKADDATDERDAVRRSLKAVPPKDGVGTSDVDQLFAVALPFLDAEIALAQHDPPAARAAFRKAETAEDMLPYAEPPSWFVPVREHFGAFLLRRNELPQAEVVFKRALINNRGSGRALFGLAETLKREGKEEEAQKVEAEYTTAWSTSDVHLTVEDL